MKSPCSVQHYINKRRLQSPDLAGKHLRVVYFQPIAQWLPNGLPNLTGVLAVATFRSGSFLIQAHLCVTTRKGQRDVKIVSVYNLAQHKWACQQVSNNLLVSRRVKMTTRRFRTKAYRNVPGEGH